MKTNTFQTLFLLFALLLGFSCSNPCKDVNCGNGICNKDNGDCSCNDGWVQDTNGLCTIANSDKFVGTWKVVENCPSGTYNYEVSITKNNYENKIIGKSTVHFWKEQIMELGGEYLIWSNAPENPYLN